MIKKEPGASSENEAPVNQVTAVKQITYNVNSSAKGQARKSNNKTLSGAWNHAETKAQLQTYLNLGLTPIPLKAKRPIVKWVHGDWHPKTIEDLAPYKNCVNWGIKTGGGLGVLDFDNEQSFFHFVEANIEDLPKNTPLVRTGRGYHIWFHPIQPLRDMHFIGIDIKGDGGMVVVPPSIHPKTNRRYQFKWPIEGDLPELDITKLRFPDLKRRSNEKSGDKKNNRGASNPGGEKDNLGIPTDKPRFDFSLIKDGVGEGERHTALVSYIGHLIFHDLSREQILILAMDWNNRNRPPLSKEEVEATVNNCYSRYAKDKTQDNKKVAIKTLNKFNSVFVETKPYQQIDRNLSQHTRELPVATPILEPVSPWETENDRPPNYFDCGKKRAIMRRGREFMSVSFFCGRWDCKRCGPYFRQRWIDHITLKTVGIQLYVTELDADDWARVRRSINRLGADYMKIRSGGVFKIITDKPLKDSKVLMPEDVKGYLESAIPSTDSQCPISTSRNWRREKNTKKDNDYKKVTTTWLPLKDQLEVAQELGARKVQYNRWISPEDADDAEWADKFKQGIAERERSILHWLIKPKNSNRILEMATEWQYYLNQQYAVDALDDEQGHESYLDKYLVEAA